MDQPASTEVLFLIAANAAARAACREEHNRRYQTYLPRSNTSDSGVLTSVPCLRFTSSDIRHQSFGLLATIGRDPSLCTVVIDIPTVSRGHCHFFVHPVQRMVYLCNTSPNGLHTWERGSWRLQNECAIPVVDLLNQRLLMSKFRVGGAEFHIRAPSSTIPLRLVVPDSGFMEPVAEGSHSTDVDTDPEDGSLRRDGEEAEAEAEADDEGDEDEGDDSDA